MKTPLTRSIFTAVLCAQLMTPCLAQSEAAQQTAIRAKNLIKQRNYSEAISQLNAALKTAATDIDKAEFLLILAQATERMAATQKEKTVASVSKSRLEAVALDDQVVALPGATQAQKKEALKQATLYLKLEGRRDDANQRRKSLLAMTDLSPKERADLLQELAGQTQDQDEALGYLDQAAALPGLSVTDRAFLLLKTGRAQLQMGQLESAAKSFQTVDEMAGLQKSWRTAAGLGLTEVDLAAGRVKAGSERVRALVFDHAKADVTQYTVLTLAKKFREVKDHETYIFLMEYLSQDPPHSGNQSESASLDLADYYASQQQSDKAHRILQKLPFSRRAIVKDLELYHSQGQADQLAQRYSEVVVLVKEKRRSQPSESLDALWQYLPGLAGRYVGAYGQSKSPKAAVSLLKSVLEFYPPDTARGKAILTEISRLESL